MIYRLLFVLLLLPAFACAQVIPASQRTDWSKAGIDTATYITPTNSVSITTFGGTGDGVTDNSNAFFAAMVWFGGAPGTVLIPQGTFLLRSPLNIPANITLKGAATDKTTLLFDLNGAASNCINITRYQSLSFVPVSAGFTKGSDTLVLSSAAGFNTGDMIELREQNGTWDTQPASWAAYSVGQLVKISSITGNTLHLEQPLRIDYTLSLSPEIRRIDPVSNISIECLRIERQDAASAGYNIYFSYAYNCRVKDVESYHSAGAHIMAETSSHLTFTGNYIHHAFAYDGTSTRGYGITLAAHTSDCLAEDNVLEHLRHAMMVKQGANGNVFAYNYSFVPFRTEAPVNGGGDISLHGHYAYANLFEGNIIQTIHIDQAWGPSGPYNTFFRNRAELYGIIMSSGSVQSDMQNFVGNEITHPTSGFFILNGTGHFQYGNNVQGTIQPTGTNALPDSSYYLASAPSSWNNAAWPSIGTPNAPGTGSNPASEDFASGMPTGCWAVPLGVTELNGNDIINVYPNPAHDRIAIMLHNNEEATILLFDVTGKTILSIKKSTGIVELDLTALPEGLYILEVRQGISVARQKIVRQL